MIDLNPEWSASVWVNIATSVSASICFITMAFLGWRRRNELNVIQDGERRAVSHVIAGMVLFFVGRGIQIGEAGATVAQPWFLSIGVYMAIACLVCTVIMLRQRNDVRTVNDPASDWKPGDEDRRSGSDRRQAPAE